MEARYFYEESCTNWSRKTIIKNGKGEGELAIVFFLAAAAAWLTHLYVCFTAAKWGFLIAGAIFFPVAMFMVSDFGLVFGS